MTDPLDARQGPMTLAQLEETAKTYNKKGVAALHGSNAREAMTWFDKAMALYEMCKDERANEVVMKLKAATLSNKGCVYKKLGQYGEAIWHMKGALEIDASSPSTLTNYAACLTAVGRCDDAIQQCRRSIDALNALADATQHGGQHLLVVTYHNLALAQMSSTREQHFAYSSFMEALSFAHAYLGPSHPTALAVEQSFTNARQGLTPPRRKTSKIKLPKIRGVEKPKNLGLGKAAFTQGGPPLTKKDAMQTQEKRQQEMKQRQERKKSEGAVKAAKLLRQNEQEMFKPTKPADPQPLEKNRPRGQSVGSIADEELLQEGEGLLAELRMQRKEAQQELEQREAWNKQAAMLQKHEEQERQEWQRQRKDELWHLQQLHEQDRIKDEESEPRQQTPVQCKSYTPEVHPTPPSRVTPNSSDSQEIPLIPRKVENNPRTFAELKQELQSTHRETSTPSSGSCSTPTEVLTTQSQRKKRFATRRQSRLKHIEEQEKEENHRLKVLQEEKRQTAVYIEKMKAIEKRREMRQTRAAWKIQKVFREHLERKRALQRTRLKEREAQDGGVILKYACKWLSETAGARLLVRKTPKELIVIEEMTMVLQRAWRACQAKMVVETKRVAKEQFWKDRMAREVQNARATEIQKTIRGWHARRKVDNIRESLLYGAVTSIWEWWQKKRVRLIAHTAWAEKKIKADKSSTAISSAWRGYAGRQKAAYVKLRKRMANVMSEEIKSAVKIQQMYRMYKALKRVGLFKLRKRVLLEQQQSRAHIGIEEDDCRTDIFSENKTGLQILREDVKRRAKLPAANAFMEECRQKKLDNITMLYERRIRNVFGPTKGELFKIQNEKERDAKKLSALVNFAKVMLAIHRLQRVFRKWILDLTPAKRNKNSMIRSYYRNVRETRQLMEKQNAQKSPTPGTARHERHKAMQEIEELMEQNRPEIPLRKAEADKVKLLEEEACRERDAAMQVKEREACFVDIAARYEEARAEGRVAECQNLKIKIETAVMRRYLDPCAHPAPSVLDSYAYLVPKPV